MPRAMSRLLVTLIAGAIIALAFIAFGHSAQAQTQQTEKYFDKRGHYLGKSETRGNTTRYYDNRGHLQGTSKGTARSNPPRR